MLDLKPGDCLLYSGRSVWSWFIKVKTWSAISHVEVSIGGNYTVASRDGEGVGLYLVSQKHLSAVLRPTDPFDHHAALVWFKAQAEGQKYDWWGLARFFRLGKQSTDKQFCSEFATRFYRAGGFHPFEPGYDADLTSPGMFLSSPHLTCVWRAEP